MSTPTAIREFSTQNFEEPEMSILSSQLGE